MFGKPGSFLGDASLSAILAGVVSTLIAYARPLVIVFQAAQGLSPALLVSWVWTISTGSGVLGLILSLHYRVPVVVAWSAPGSALLITLLPTVDFAEAVGAYLVVSFAVFIIGLTGTFDRIIGRLPAGIASAMLAGILFGFAAKMFLALPLTVVALTGQWVPDIAVLRGSDYPRPGASPLIAWSAVVSAVLAPFGCHGLNLTAFTAAICTGRESHEDPAKRYVAGVAGSLSYILLGCISATVALFAMLPKELIAALAGVALFPTIATALSASLADAGDRDAALVTFIVSASGMSLLGLRAAFWGLLFGVATHFLLRWRPARQPHSNIERS